jgi:hypothetical protein
MIPRMSSGLRLAPIGAAALAVLAVLPLLAPVAPLGPLTSRVALARSSTPPVLDVAALRGLSRRLAPVPLEVDLRALPPSERAALVKILEAARAMDAIFLRQSWPGNPSLLVSLAADATPLGRARLEAFLQNKGPWLRLDDNRPFLPGVPPKPPGAGFYPPGATKRELAEWHAALSPAARAEATGFFSVVRRGPDGAFRAVPYSVEYQGELALAAARLREAAALTAQPSLRAFLEARARAFETNDYRESDVAWMKLDSSIEPTIGPYEVYEDELANAKAAFEAFVTIRDDEETAKLARLSAELQGIEDNLPIDPKLRNPKLGALAPIRVVSSLFSSGDANRGVQTAAFNLPNDEAVTAVHGAKRTMLKNVQEAKFALVLVPIAKAALPPAERANVSFEAFFTHILMHELMHGLGPHSIVLGGKATTVRAALEETSSAIEEAKADVSGLFALQRLVDNGVLDRRLERTMYTTFLASTFRSIRFGLNEAHGKGMALQLNTFLDAQAFRVGKDGTFSVDAPRMKEAVRRLTGELMTLQARGDKAAAAELLRTRAVLRPEVARVLARIKSIPVDIAPRFVTAEALLRGTP